MPAVDLFGELVESTHMTLGARSSEHLFSLPAQPGRRRLEDAAVIDAVVPHVEEPHLSVAPHAPAIAADDGARGLLGISKVTPHEAHGDGGARDQALYVPLPRSGIDLVEIVDGEDQVAFG